MTNKFPESKNRNQGIILLVGLGNPGSKYSQNRHNVGFMVIDALRKKYSAGKEQLKFGGAVSEIMIDDRRILLFKPLSYMNHSGLPTIELVRFFKIPLENITIFHDDLDLNFGKIRVKTGGGHAGHNGLKSLDAHLGAEYKRVRIGISHPGDKEQVYNHVLSDFSKDEQLQIDNLAVNICENIKLLLEGDDSGFMNRITIA